MPVTEKSSAESTVVLKRHIEEFQFRGGHTERDAIVVDI